MMDKKGVKNSANSETTKANKQVNKNSLVIENPWRVLREFTDARIGLGRTGVSLPSAELLAFQLAHAQARDAVHLALDTSLLVEQIDSSGLSFAWPSPILLHSQASDRVSYLQRPDLGRRLHADSHDILTQITITNAAGILPTYDLAIVVVDGLSSFAVQQHSLTFMLALDKLLQQDSSRNTKQAWKVAPLTIVQQGRVAIGDEVGALLNANAVVVLIGERPGLSSPDSLGLYMTWAPKVGLSDASRNCISNIRPAGLDIAQASKKAMYLLRESRAKQLTGVGLKDRTSDTLLEHKASSNNFLLG
jgi:ethanolamine ammonia-lyase small subunit